MDVTDLLRFFGFPATSCDFSEFLSSHGIEDRPSFNSETGNLFENMELPDSGFSLQFVMPREYEEDFGPAREPDGMIFSQIYIFLIPEGWYRSYTGKLPAVLPATLTPDACVGAFGTPDFVRDDDDNFGQPNTIEYTWDRVGELSIFVRFFKTPQVAKEVVINPAKK
jgi:hypothetical protein